MHKTILLFSGALLLAIAPTPIQAQNFDTSGTSSLSGPYLFRYVNYYNDGNGNVTESCSLTGVMTFDGSGKYTLSNTQLYDSMGTTGGSCASLGGGTYGVQPNGIAQLDNPMYAATLFGTFSKPVITASSTEDDYFDLFIAVQAPSNSFSNSNFSGSFTAGMMDYLNSSGTYLARQGYFTLNADGKGNISAFTVNGSAANLSTSNITQSVTASYSLSGTSGGTLNVSGSSGDASQILSGAQILYVSADGNYVVGGSATGSDIIFGFRAPSGTGSNSLLNGTYFISGMDASVPSTTCSAFNSCFLDAFYGSINSNGNGNLFWHERFDDVVDVATYDNTFNTPVTLESNGSYFDGTYYYFAGANGTALMLLGSGQQFSLNIGVHAPSVTPTSSVWLDPVGINNAANYTPITNAYAPGELVNLYGNFGVSTKVDSQLPVPAELSGVQVLVNGTAAPVYLVSANQISALIPYEVSNDYFATFQVVVNGSKSNTVTVYVDYTAPGIYTLPQSGIGAGAILHANYTEVTDSSPAQPGETVLLFMNGLGTVTPTVANGAIGPSNPLSTSDEEADIYIGLDDGVDQLAQANVEFAGLAPCCVGLYQVNFTVPSSGLQNGDVYISFNTIEAGNEMATIAVSGFPQSAERTAARRPRTMRKIRAALANPAHAKAVRDHRRALPERSREKF